MSLNQHSLETTDIFRSAFFLCNGGDLCGMRIKNNGSRIATFLIQGEGLGSLPDNVSRKTVELQFEYVVVVVGEVLKAVQGADLGESRTSVHEADASRNPSARGVREGSLRRWPRRIGGMRVVQMPYGRELPRIC